MEKLTSLAALRAGDIEKIQKLETELERAATHRQNYEEKGRRYKDAVEEVRAGVAVGTPMHFPWGTRACVEQISTGQSRFGGGTTWRGGQRTGVQAGRRRMIQEAQHRFSLLPMFTK